MNKRIKPYHIFLLPSLIGVCIFTLIPFAGVIRGSFLNAGSLFCGLANYIEIFQNSAFLLAFFNTILFTTISSLLLMILAVSLSLVLFQLGFIGHIFKSIQLLPMAVPVASVALFWILLFDNNGILNGIRDTFNLHPVDWLNSKYVMWILILLFIWKNIGFITLLWIIGLGAIPQQIYDAAKVDGAGKGQLFFRIVLPNLKQTLYLSIIFSLIYSSKIYREAYLLAGDYPSTNMYLLQHTFNNWFRNYDFDKLSAGAVVYAVIIVMVVLGLQKLNRTE